VAPAKKWRAFGERVEALDPFGQALPGVTRIGGKAAVEPAGDDDPVLEGRAQLRRQRETVLVVEGVLMFTEQHGPPPPTIPHFPPHVNL
jgi:hypothetical protein